MCLGTTKMVLCTLFWTCNGHLKACNGQLGVCINCPKHAEHRIKVYFSIIHHLLEKKMDPATTIMSCMHSYRQSYIDDHNPWFNWLEMDAELKRLCPKLNKCWTYDIHQKNSLHHDDRRRSSRVGVGVGRQCCST